MSRQILSSSERAKQRRFNLSRRRFLQGLGLGVSVALPAFESLEMPRLAGAATQAADAGLAVTKSGAPLRMAFLYFPNGAIPANWWPTGEGADFQLSKTLAPLADVKRKLQVFAGLDHRNAAPGPDGAGDHARASG